MAEELAISVDHVSKSFKLPHEKATGLKQAMISFRPGKKYSMQPVLRDVSLQVKKGEFFGIVGRNGSGKSTLLKLLAQIYVPDRGAVKIIGSLIPFIELGVGFNPELTGRENVFLNGALLGVDRKQMATMYDGIVEFAELEEFMDLKLKNYSSGMQVRLAFSVAIRVKSDILLVDEVLAVGDAAFQRKCYDYFMKLKFKKATVVLVTHDMNAIRQYCDRAIIIEGGKVVHSGSPEDIAQDYQRLFTKQVTTTPASEDEDRWGNGKVRGRVLSTKITERSVVLSTHYKVLADISSLVVGFTIHGPNGTNIVEDNSIRHKEKFGAFKKGEEVTFNWEIPNIFASGRYRLIVACCDQSTTEFYDWFNNAAVFEVVKEMATSGLVQPSVKMIKREGVGIKL